MTFEKTRWACYWGYVTQAVVNNLAPVLFVVFQDRFHVPEEMLGRLVLLNFTTQLLTDVVAVRYVGRWGYRMPLVTAHALAGAGLMLLARTTLAICLVGCCQETMIPNIGCSQINTQVFLAARRT